MAVVFVSVFVSVVASAALVVAAVVVVDFLSPNRFVIFTIFTQLGLMCKINSWKHLKRVSGQYTR